jgi:hypothetical protein
MALYLSSRFTNYQEVSGPILIQNLCTLDEMSIIVNGKWYSALCISVNPSDDARAIGNTFIVYKGQDLKGRVVAPCPPFCHNDGGIDLVYFKSEIDE